MAKIIFFGTPQFAVPSLDALIRNGHQVVAVVTSVDKPAGRGLKLKSSPVKEFALLHHLDILQPVKLNEAAFISKLQSYQADLFVVVAFRMLPESVWNMPPWGTYNVHSSLLPLYRGAAPINRAIMDGCHQTGVTTFKLKHEIDTGEVLLQAQTTIGPDETAGELHDRLMGMGAALLVDTIALIESGKAEPVPQDSLNQNRIPLPMAPKIFSHDCEIQWDWDALRIHNLVRGLSPFPGAFTTLVGLDGKNQKIKVFKCAMTSTTSICKPGTIKVKSDQLFIATGSVDLQILELQLEGKKRMHTGDFLRGNNLTQSSMR